MKPSVMHYSGKLQYQTGTRLTIFTGGTPVCTSSGQREMRIKQSGMMTENAQEVTCAACKRQLERGASHETQQKLSAMFRGEKT